MARMKQVKARWRGIVGFLAMACLALALLPGGAGRAEARSLSVALFPHVPDQARFRQAVEAEWNARHPEVKLEFVSWDGYLEDPPADLDVFVYDALLLHDFLEKGCLLPLDEKDIRDADDFIPCAMAACRVDGTVYALPQMLCTYLLYSREGDDEVSGARNIRQLHQAVGDSGGPGIPPAEGEGLLLSMPNAMIEAFWYLEIQTDVEQAYSEWVALPEAGALDEDIVSRLQMLRDMAGNGQLSYFSPDGDTYIRGAWFAQGLGRAFIGESEAMSAMGDAVDDMVFHRISLSDDEDVPMLYADIASVNARISDERKPLAVELLDVITNAQTMAASFAAGHEGQSPQYLLGARLSVYDLLSKEEPVYGGLKAIVSDPKCRVFVVRPGCRPLLARAAHVFLY